MTSPTMEPNLFSLNSQISVRFGSIGPSDSGNGDP
jgi:hypothetical protein